MNAEQLRNAKIHRVDSLLNGGWLVQRYLTDEDRRMLRADRAFWATATPDELARGLVCYEQQPARQEAFFEPKCLKCGRHLSVCMGCVECGHVETLADAKEAK